MTIHYPPSAYLDDSARRSVLADLPGLRLAKNVLLQREDRLGASGTPLHFRGSSQRLLLRIHNKVRCQTLCDGIRSVCCLCVAPLLICQANSPAAARG